MALAFTSLLEASDEPLVLLWRGNLHGYCVSCTGIEPVTRSFRGSRSTIELTTQIA